MGLSESSSSPKYSERRAASRERIMFLLPRSVLISPLWHSTRKGCARAHEGKVLVEKRECTNARWDLYSGLCRSLK